MSIVLVAIGGGFGACLRFLIDHRLRGRHGSTFPWGTLLANLLGTLILGFLTGATLFGVEVPWVRSLLGVGFCGALTTYSTFGYETVQLFTTGPRLLSIANLAATILAGLGAALLGITIAAAIWA